VIIDLISFRAAKVLIDQHGIDAPKIASLKLERLLDEDNLDGAAVWLRILAAAEELARDRREGEALH
jgi:hypothetical protein